MSEKNETEGLLKRLVELLGDRPVPSGIVPGQAVPYEQFMKANDRAKAAEKALEEMEARVKGLEKTFKDELKTAKEGFAAELGKREASHAEDLKLRDLDLDTDGRAEVRRQWERQPEATRPASPSEYWQSILDANKAHQLDPEKAAAPEIARTLGPYLPTIEKPDGDKGDKGGKGKTQTRSLGGPVVLSPDRNAGGRNDGSDGHAAKIGSATNWKELGEALRNADNASEA